MDVDIKEAKEIARMCKAELYPPTNPAVLCRAILAIYLKEGWNKDCQKILNWFCYTEKGCPKPGKE